MNLSEVGVLNQQIDVLRGGDVDSAGRLLSVGEIQQHFRDLVEARRREARHPLGPVRAHDGEVSDTTPLQLPEQAQITRHRVPASTAHPVSSQSPAAGSLQPEWIAVLAAHAGAGASTVALAITDALSTAGRRARLVETAHPARSGLLAAASAELGTDPTGSWRHGSRQGATLYRRAGDIAPTGWPDPVDGEQTVIDLGLPAPENLRRLATDQPTVVIVCRPTVPGVRMAEHTLTALTTPAVLLVAAIGGPRWPAEVTASLGPLLRIRRDMGQVITVREDRQLHATGLTRDVLPKHVAAAGRDLLTHIDAARPGDGTTSAPSTPRWRGTQR